MDSLINNQAKSIEVTAIITRADGTVEQLGTINYWHKNPIKRIIWRIKTWLHS
jgi:hypothetical protein